MKEKIRAHLDELFSHAPDNKKAWELKEEIYLNLCEKYDDLVKGGKSEEEAYQSAIDGIGDVNDLIRALKNDDVFDYTKTEKERKKTALIVSISVALYIMSLMSIILIVEVLDLPEGWGALSLFTFAAAATCLLVYHFISRPKYHRADDTLVEEFKEWKSNSNKMYKLEKSIISTMWTLIVAIYLIISFVFNAWAFSWIIFIIGAVIAKIIKIIFDLKE